MAAVNVEKYSAVFTWTGSRESTTAASATRGTFDFSTGSSLIWDLGKFEWTWIELLEWLSENWVAIVGDDGLPFAVNPENAADLNRYLDSQAREVSDAVVEDQRSVLWTFLESHDLGRGLLGAEPPQLVAWREGLVGHILTPRGHFRSAWHSLESILTEIGDAIAVRVGAFATDGRALAAVTSWNARQNVSARQVVAQVTGVADAAVPIILAFWKRESVGKNLSAVVARSEILVAARMTAGLSEDLITVLLTEIAATDLRNTADLDQFAAQIDMDEVSTTDLRPFEQGHLAAQQVREILGLSDNVRFDPQSWLVENGIEYRETRLGVRGIDAVAAWGDQHGPVVIINLDGTHSQASSGRNASIAHEIGHLLLDRFDGLPAAEVLGGRTNPFVEARARAFAAELLLPRAVAGENLAQAESSLETKAAVEYLCRRFRVSAEVVAWQARNSGIQLAHVVRSTLATYVSAPWQF